ncbi:helix-turn-helix transcriptional regulator [Fodinibacter luteus]|uniref:helix-turn-helix transcriptional regulator n=1 Tax=Fodinibacter luteus TaxID=552064 RepID=UPI0031ED81CB
MVAPTEALDDAWHHLEHSHGNLVLVGAPGSGKTTTLTALETRCARHGIPVHRFGPTGDASPAGVRPRAVPGQPSLLLLDDADRTQESELARCLRWVHDDGARLVATVRPGSLGSPVEALSDLARTARTLVLEPWNELEVAGLLEALHDPTPPGEVHAATRGLPWLVRDVVAATTPPAAAHVPVPRGACSAAPGGLARHVLRLLRECPAVQSDLVLALAAGYPSHGEPLAPALRGLPPAEARAAADTLWHTGLVALDGELPPVVRDALLRHAPPHRLRPLLDSLVDDLSTTGGDLRAVAPTLVTLGVRDPRLTAAVTDEVSRLLPRSPAAAAALAGAALSAGADGRDGAHGGGSELRALQAEALGLAGDLEAAAVALSPVPGGALSSHGERVAMTLAVLGGQPGQGARLARWVLDHPGAAPDPTTSACAALALAGRGDAAAARALLAAGGATGPDVTVSPLPEMAEAVLLTLGEHRHHALPGLVRIAGRGRRPELLPDVPAALAALVAVNGGDLAIAESVLAGSGRGRPDAGIEAPAVDASRISALRGWVSMLAGRYGEAAQHLDRIDPAVPRDEPWAWGLRLGLARRQDDIRGLTALWPAARTVLVGHPVDLYSLLPLGEIGLAAARMHEPDLAAAVWDQARDLLVELGGAPLWAAPFHWYAVQAAVLTDRPDAMAADARALVVAARTDPVAATYAAAGRTWVSVLGRDVDPAAVARSARALAAVGQAWEGARLAGHAAARVADRKEAAALLDCARGLVAQPAPGDEGEVASPPTPAQVRAGAIVMSEREHEVAQLVVAGLTYQEIGERLFVSARTVEHHVARIKRRSGAQSRSELLSRLSLTLEAHSAAPPR